MVSDSLKNMADLLVTQIRYNRAERVEMWLGALNLILILPLISFALSQHTDFFHGGMRILVSRL